MTTTKVILLKGDPKNPESAEHIIKFPGGYVSVTRTSDNEYWAHIGVNHKQVTNQAGTVEQAGGEIVDSRMDYDYPDSEIREIPYAPSCNHVAVRIATEPATD
jgi:hypothetical protein